MYFFIVSSFIVVLAFSAAQEQVYTASEMPEPVYNVLQEYVPTYSPQQPEPAYGQQPEPTYSPQQPEPAYGQQPEPTYSPQQPEPAYDKQPEPTYGQQPEPAYGQQPEPAYGQQPEPTYSPQQPEPAYGQQPEPAYGQQPEPTYSPQQPESAYSPQQPEKTYSSPEQPEPIFTISHSSGSNVLIDSQTPKQISEAITAKIVGPIVLFNSKVAAAAGALPPLLAAKGAMFGSAIATPIHVGAVASSAVVSKVTGKLVSVPIAVGTGAVAKLKSAAKSGEQIWNFNVEHGGEMLKNGLIKIGHIVLKPVAVVFGAQTALTGAGVGIAGTGIKGVGVGMEAIGAKMFASGLVAKGLGHRLIAKNLLPPFVK